MSCSGLLSLVILSLILQVDFDMTHSKQIDLVTLNAITLASEAAAVRYAGPSSLRSAAHIGRNFVMGSGSCFDPAALATITEDYDLTSPWYVLLLLSYISTWNLGFL